MRCWRRQAERSLADLIGPIWASVKGSPDPGGGRSRLATGKLKEELKTLALRAARPLLGHDRLFGSGIGPRQAGSGAKRVVFRMNLWPAGHAPTFFHNFINLDPQTAL